MEDEPGVRLRGTRPEKEPVGATSSQVPPAKSRLISWTELHPDARDNGYITTGYRRPAQTWRTSLGSVLYLHNETVNILTHGLGAVFFAISGIVYLYTIYGNGTSSRRSTALLDAIVLGVFYTSATICMSFSATFHCLSDLMDRDTVKMWNRLDYAGIVVLIWGSFVPSLRFGFRGAPGLMTGYIGMMTVFALVTLYMTLKPHFGTPEYRATRAGMFVALGLSGVLPVLHGLYIHGAAELQQRMGLDLVLSEGALYILGAGLYAARVPERHRPVKHDLIGSSHQIFHVLVVAAAYLHLLSLRRAWHYEHGV